MSVRPNELRLAWEGWEGLLLTKLKELDHFIEAMQRDLVHVGMRQADTGPFIAAKVYEMNELIQAEKANKEESN